MNLSIYLTGLSTGLSLIVAIGAQNAFVLRQGLRNQHVLAVTLICASSDALLIAAGVGGFAKLAAGWPWLDPLMRYGGAAFLAWTGAKALYAALSSKSALAPEDGAESPGLAAAILTCLAFTWANPHVYLDTLVLLGAVSTQFPGHQTAFAAGAMSGSFLFFFALGYGAAWLRPLFARPGAWRAFEAATAAVMWTVSIKLVTAA